MVDFEPTSFARSIASLAWRTGFPVSMPSGVVQRAQDFYNKLMQDVAATDITLINRKPLASLKVDLDLIVDSVMEHVRQSPEGIYTNYLKIQVGDVTLDEALYRVGVQLKAYGVDLTNYRDIAGAVLGIPILPQVASTVMGAVQMTPGVAFVGDLTSGTVQTVGMLPGAAYSAVSQASGTALGTIKSLPRLPSIIFGSSSSAPANVEVVVS